MGKMKALLGDVSYDEFIEESEVGNHEWLGTEYKRRDYYFARTSQEAFGVQAKPEDFVTDSHVVHDEPTWVEVSIACLFVLGLVYVSFLLGE